MSNMENKVSITMPIRDCFPFYYSFKDALGELEENDRLEIYDGITNYAFYKKEPSLSTPIARACWKLIRPLLDKSQRNFENGNKGGAPKGSRNNPNGRRGNLVRTNRELTEELTETNRELTEELTETNQELSNKEIEKEIEKDNLVVSDEPKPRTQSRMKRPTLSEVESYMVEKGAVNARDEAEAFIDYYDAKGWIIGKVPMKRWRSAANIWLRNSKKYETDKVNSPKSVTASNIAEAQRFAITKMGE